MNKFLALWDSNSVKIVPIFLALLMFAFPVSSSGKSIFLVLSVITILLSPYYRKRIKQAFAKEWAIAALVLFAIALIACLWSPATLRDKWFVVEKYSKLLYLPVLAAGFVASRTRRICLHFFVFSVLFISLLALMKYFGFLPTLKFSSEHVFRNHIITGLMAAYAAYLSFWFAYNEEKLLYRLSYILMGLIISYFTLCINGGFTGYVVFLLLMVLLVLQIGTVVQVVISFFAICALFAGSYFISTPMHNKVNAVIRDIQSYDVNKNTSVGLRLQFHAFAQTLFMKHPIVGNGTASFTYYFNALNPVPIWARRLWEPHGQYWLVAAEFGLIGLLSLLFFFGSLIKASMSLTTMRAAAWGMLLAFLMGNLSDSLLFYSGPGYLFLFFMALCLGEQLESMYSDKDFENHTADKLKG